MLRNVPLSYLRLVIHLLVFYQVDDEVACILCRCYLIFVVDTILSSSNKCNDISKFINTITVPLYRFLRLIEYKLDTFLLMLLLSVQFQ